MERRNRKSRKTDFNYFAVSNGHQIGIFTSWPEASKSVTGFSKNCYKGCDTLEEAFALMRSAGIAEPPVLEHFSADSAKTGILHQSNNPTIGTSSSDCGKTLTTETQNNGMNRPPLCSFSDSDVNLEMFFDADADFENVQNRPVLVLQHDNNTDVKESMAANRISESDDEVVLSATKSIELKESCQITSNSTAEKQDPHDTYFQSISESTVDNLPTAQTDSNELFKSLVYQISNLTREVKSQHECIASFTQTTQMLIEQLNKQQRDHELLSEIVSKQVKDQDVLINDLKEIKMKCDINQPDQAFNTDKISSQMKTIVEQCDYLQSGQSELRSKMSMCCSDHDQLLAQSEKSTAVTQQLVLMVEKQGEQLYRIQQADSKNLNPVPQQPRPILPQHSWPSIPLHATPMSPDEQIPTMPKPNENKTLETNIAGNSMHHQHPVSDMDKEEEDISFEDKDILKFHPHVNNFNKSSQAPRKHVPTLNVPDSCKNIVIGDSNLQYVIKKRLDPSGSTEIRTYRGANIRRICTILDSSNERYMNIKNVVYTVGSINCNRSFIQESYILDDIDLLIDLSKEIFPSAKIYVLSIPPQMNSKSNVHIHKVNEHLRKYLKTSKTCSFVRCTELWDHVDQDGSPERSILQYGLQLSHLGTKLLLKPITTILLGDRQSSSSQNIISSEKTPAKPVAQFDKCTPSAKSDDERNSSVNGLFHKQDASFSSSSAIPNASAHDCQPTVLGMSPLGPVRNNLPMFPTPQMLFHMHMFEKAKMSAMQLMSNPHLLSPSLPTHT